LPSVPRLVRRRAHVFLTLALASFGLLTGGCLRRRRLSL
jgi:hypothetical protein